MDFNEVFRKNVAYDDIKNYNKSELHRLSIKSFLEKPEGATNIHQDLFRFEFFNINNLS